MLNLKNVLVLASSAVILGACSGASSETTDNATSNTTTESTLVESSTTVTEPKEESKPVVASDKGKRTNPYKFGEAARAEFGYYDGDGTYEAALDLVLSNPVRGEEAYNWLLEQNMYNAPAPEGYEWIVFDVAGTLVEGDDNAPLAQIVQVSSVSASGAQSSPDIYATFDGQYGEAELYKGGTSVGKLATVVPTNEAFTIQISLQFESDTHFVIE